MSQSLRADRGHRFQTCWRHRSVGERPLGVNPWLRAGPCRLESCRLESCRLASSQPVQLRRLVAAEEGPQQWQSPRTQTIRIQRLGISTLYPPAVHILMVNLAAVKTQLRVPSIMPSMSFFSADVAEITRRTAAPGSAHRLKTFIFPKAWGTARRTLSRLTRYEE